jgi:hypothetical protein
MAWPESGLTKAWLFDASRSILAGEPGKVRQYGRNQIAMMGVGRAEIRCL